MDTHGYGFKAQDKDIASAYECGFCHNIVKEFTELPCCHAFCKNCLEVLEEQTLDEDEREATISQCVLCKQTYGKDEKQTCTESDTFITEHLQLLCPCFDQGCDWTGTISSYVNYHGVEECIYQKIFCPFIEAGCNTTVMRKDLESHKSTFNVQHTEMLLLKVANKHRIGSNSVKKDK